MCLLEDLVEHPNFAFGKFPVDVKGAADVGVTAIVQHGAVTAGFQAEVALLEKRGSVRRLRCVGGRWGHLSSRRNSGYHQ